MNGRVNGSIPSNRSGNVPRERLKWDLCLLRVELNNVPKNGHIVANRVLKHGNGVSDNDVFFVVGDIWDYWRRRAIDRLETLSISRWGRATTASWCNVIMHRGYIQCSNGWLDEWVWHSFETMKTVKDNIVHFKTATIIWLQSEWANIIGSSEILISI